MIRYAYTVNRDMRGNVMEGNISDIKIGTKMILVHYLYDATSGQEIAMSYNEELIRSLWKELKELCPTRDS